MKTIINARGVAIATAIGTFAVIGACSGGSSTAPGNGTMVVQLTDAAFTLDSVQSANVFVVRIDGRQADADSATAAKGATDDSASVGGWKALATPNTSINLLAYQNGATLALGTVSLPAGSYAGFRLVIDPTRSNITLKNGVVLTGTSTPSIVFPSGSRDGIKVVLSAPITIATNGTTTMLVDFNLASSFVLRGNSLAQNGLLFKPVITATVK